MQRTTSIDLLRGLIMVFMALDHASGMIGRVHFTEIWGTDFTQYPDIFWWFTRFISHLCAPGFFLLMGMSMYMFGKKRLEAGWEAKKVNLYFLKRGGLILLFMFFLEFPGWGLSFAFNQTASESPPLPGNLEGGFPIPSTVLFGLGMCMIIGSLLWRARAWQWILIVIGSFALSGWYISISDPRVAFNPLEHIFLVPGASPFAMTLYPVLPWLGVTAFGMLWGKLIKDLGRKAFDYAAITGLAFVVAFAALRSGGWGNLTYPDYHDFITFFTLIKYPPSVAFILITIGLNLLLLNVFSRIEGKKWLKPLLIFGQTAMFYYIIHLYLYALIGALFPLGAHIAVMYACWLGGLVLLYFICNRFLQFKKRTPLASFWRMV